MHPCSWYRGRLLSSGYLSFLPVLFGVLRLFGFYTVVNERESKVYVLFGKVVGELDEPGFHFLWPKLGLSAR